MKKHGISIGIERVGEDVFVLLKAVGKLTHEDYEVIVPLLDSALAEVTMPRVRVLIDGTEMEGWELRAAWDDLKLSLKHGKKFEKIAIYGNKHWQEMAAKIGRWFLSGDVKYFEQYEQALSWLKGEDVVN